MLTPLRSSGAMVRQLWPASRAHGNGQNQRWPINSRGGARSADKANFFRKSISQTDLGGTWGGGGHKNWRNGISCSATCLPPSYLIGRSSVRISNLSSACLIKLIDFDISLRSSYQVPKRNDMISGLFLLKGTRTLLMVGRSDPGEEADLDMPGVDQDEGLQQQQ